MTDKKVFLAEIEKLTEVVSKLGEIAEMVFPEPDLSEYAKLTDIPDVSGKQDVIAYERPAVFNTNYTEGQLFLWDGCLYRYIRTITEQGIGTFAYFIRFGRKIRPAYVGYPSANPPSTEIVNGVATYQAGDLFADGSNSTVNSEGKIVGDGYICMNVVHTKSGSNMQYSYTWKKVVLDVYSKTEVDTLISTAIGNIETALSQI